MADNDTARKPGRPTKLTPEVQAGIVQRILEGYAVRSAARLNGIAPATAYDWLRRGRAGEGEFLEFLERVRAAWREAAQIKIRTNPRPLARARYEYDNSPEEIAMKVHAEIMRMIEGGRVPFDCALQGVVWAEDDLYDKLAEESVSWAEDPAQARTHAGGRGLSGG